MSDTPEFQDINDRYQRARYTATLGSGRYEFELLRPIHGATRVIVDPESVANPTSIQEVFLINRTQLGHWFASTWPRHQNPWTNGRLRRGGATVSGRVVNFTDNYVAHIRGPLDNVPMDFRLNREDLPEKYQHTDIRDILFLGDLISGKLKQPDHRSLRLNISIRDWLQEQNIIWSKPQPDHPQNSHQDLTEPGVVIPPPRLDGKALVIIDDDDIFATALSTMLLKTNLNVTIVTRNSPKGMTEATYAALRHNPDLGNCSPPSPH